MMQSQIHFYVLFFYNKCQIWSGSCFSCRLKSCRIPRNARLLDKSICLQPTLIFQHFCPFFSPLLSPPPPSALPPCAVVALVASVSVFVLLFFVSDFCPVSSSQGGSDQTQVWSKDIPYICKSAGGMNNENSAWFWLSYLICHRRCLCLWSRPQTETLSMSWSSWKNVEDQSLSSVSKNQKKCERLQSLVCPQLPCVLGLKPWRSSAQYNQEYMIWL